MTKSMTLDKLPRPSFQFKIAHASTVKMKNIVLVTLFSLSFRGKTIMPEDSEQL